MLNWEEKLRKHSPREPEKCHAGHINQLLAEAPATYGGSRLEEDRN